MKRLLLGATLAAAIVGPAMAADLPIKVNKAPPPPPIPPATWSGFYLGGHGGCGWSQTNVGDFVTHDQVQGVPNVDVYSKPPADGKGCFGGGQIGFNYQYPNQVVLGIEADVSAGKVHGSSAVTELETPPPTEVVPFGSKLTNFETVRGRIGYASGPWLPYFTGGWAWGRNQVTQFPDIVDLANSTGVVNADKQTHTGWTVGGGLEYMFSRNWTGKVEYLYLDLRSKTYAVLFDDDVPVPTGRKPEPQGSHRQIRAQLQI